MPDQDIHPLPPWALGALRDQPAMRAGSRDRIMQRVRALPAPRSLVAPMPRSRWLRRGLLSPAGSAAATLLVLMAVAVRIGSGLFAGHAVERATFVVGDTIVKRVIHGAPGAIHDTLLDTLRIVEFVVRGRDVRSAAVTGDFNAWRITALQRATNGSEWRTRLLVPRDALRFAYLVNDAQITADPLPPVPAQRTSDSI